MQGSSQAGGTPGNGRAAPQARLFATFKLAAPYIEIVQKRTVAGNAKPAANLNRAGFAAVEQPGGPERS
ncbi:MAG: hypothetical protein IT566_03865 [Rhodospirillaceae bacterium]|nr:hypothetical protein [Rhodospirillaceae bacterium]